MLLSKYSIAVKSLLFGAIFFTAVPTLAQTIEIIPDLQETILAKVIKIEHQEIKNMPGTDTTINYQTISAKVLTGTLIGQTITLENDYLDLQIGEKFYALHTTRSDGTHTYAVSDPYRLPIIWMALGLFVLSILALGGKQGLRSIISLAGSLLLIAYVLIPLLIAGYSPILTSSVIAAIILALAIFATHGFNRESGVALAGTVSAVIVTAAFAFIATSLARLSGFASEEAVYLNFNTRGELDFAGLLLGGIIIGTLGVLDDIAITQAAVVRELYNTDKNLSRGAVYKKALRVGREHVGALVNTLALAYAGASLPLLLLLSQSTMPILAIINSETFATEIIRTVAGSIGLILTVPITTGLAVFYISKDSSGGAHAHHHHH